MPASNNPIIPEAVIFQTVKAALQTLRDDFEENASNETSSYLYKCIGQFNSIQGYNLFTQNKAVFFRAKNANEPRFVDVSMGWDTDRIQKKMPTIHIVMQSENPKDDSMGLGEGNYDYEFDDEHSTYSTSYQRRFTQQVNFLISGDNSNEKIAIYYVLKSILTSFAPYFNELGFDNISFSGGDIQINNGVSDNLYVRNLTMRFDYDSVAPQFHNTNFAKNLFYKIFVKDEKGNLIEINPDKNEQEEIS